MMNFINRNKYAVIFCALLLAGGYGGYKYYVSSQTPAQTVKTGVVERGNLVETISATGALSAVNNVDISSKITGRIVEVLVQENQHVNAGDVLVPFIFSISLRKTIQAPLSLISRRTDALR